MSVLVEAARKLAAGAGGGYRHPCEFCGHHIIPGERDSIFQHLPACPWLRLPAIVRALEAAERLASKSPWFRYTLDRGRISGTTCMICGTDNKHEDGCAWQALVDALRGAAGGGPDDQTAGP